MKTFNSAPWMFLAVPLVFVVFPPASSDFIFLKGLEGESVVFVCESEETNTHPIGLYLKRKCLEPAGEVMFFSEYGSKVKNAEDAGRLHVQGDLSANPFNVTLSQLRHRDSGVYYCDFVYGAQLGDTFKASKQDFVLLVETEGVQCNCSSYPPLLYAISAAVGLLLLILFVLGASRCGKACKRSKPQALVPIYEEMTVAKEANGKRSHYHLDLAPQGETGAPVYVNPQSKNRQGNHYESPRGKRLAPEASDTAEDNEQKRALHE